eukprot:5918151-Karenia_brevis.AAC.1
MSWHPSYQQYNTNTHMGRWRRHKQGWAPHNHSYNHTYYPAPPQHHYHRSPLPIAWICTKCRAPHHNMNLTTCRMPNCGGLNPTKILPGPG